MNPSRDRLPIFVLYHNHALAVRYNLALPEDVLTASLLAARQKKHIFVCRFMTV